MSSRANSRPKPEICIAGAGPAGLTLALALADAGISVAVASRDPKPPKANKDFDGRAYSIAQGCWRIWETLGVADALEKYAQPIDRISAQAAVGRPIIFRNDDLQSSSGPLGYMIEAQRLGRALRARADAEPLITILDKSPVSTISCDASGAVVHLETHSNPLTCRLVVGCDGRTSVVRRLSGIRWFGHDYNSSSLVATVKLKRPHANAARQAFLKSGPFAALPLQNNRANLVWTEDRDIADALCALSDEDFSAELSDRLGDFLGKFEIDGPRFAYPLIMRIAERFHADRVALVGDAAHAIHPLAGQGLNLGLKDVATLAECLVSADRAGLDLGAPMALEEYDSLRRPDVVSTAIGMDGFEKLFKAPSPLRALAGLGIGLMGDLKRARSAFAEHASAAAETSPRLMRGERLNG